MSDSTQIGQRQAQPQRQQHGHGLRRGLAQGEAQRGGHEGHGAGRGDNDGQHAGEEGARRAAARGQALADAGEAAADLEHAGEVQADHEEEIGDQQREDRRLELEAPGHLADAGADRDDDGGHGGEGDQHARRIGKAVAPHARRGRGRPAARSAAAFMASTGNTQGIRFRISPPSSANSSAWTSDSCSPSAAAASDEVGTKAGSSLADTSKACLTSPSAVFSVSTRVPASRSGSAGLGVASLQRDADAVGA